MSTKAKPAAKTAKVDRSTEAAGVGNKAEPKTIGIPEDVKIKREVVKEQATKVTESASVKGDQSLQVIDILQSRPVKVFVIDAQSFDPADEDQSKLVFIQGPVSSELLPYAQSKAKFACKPDGTVIYNSRGFDDVPKNVEFDLVDIVKLTAHNHSKKKSKK